MTAPTPTSDLRTPFRSQRGGFALVDVMTGVAVLAVTAGSVLWALTTSNRLAAVNRYYTAANAVAQKQIDEALYTPYQLPATIPSILTTGATTTPVTIASGPPAVTGKMTTTVNLADATLGIRRVTVTVDYSFRGKNYNVAMATARAPD